MRTRTFSKIAVSLCFCMSAPTSDLAAQGAVDPEHGIVAVGRLLRGLGSVKRVLVIGAHPDDEDTALLTWLERGLGADAAYLALNRGEGGQNLIGPELGVGLGLVRTGELVAARNLDGAEQFFTRAYDFGYSKSSEETFKFWSRDSLLADVVAIVREFRPQVIVSIFSGTPRDGHGQHQVAGILAHAAFDAAADVDVFSAQIEAGCAPWQALKLYRSVRFGRGTATLTVETGTFDALYGRSYHQIAMASRSQHRSQDMGRIEPLGPRQTALQLITSRVGSDSEADESSIFDGVDTTLVGMLSPISAAGTRAALAEALTAYGSHLLRAREGLGQWASSSTVAHLAVALTSLRRALELSESLGVDGGDLRFVLGKQETRLESALAEAAGVIVDAFTDDDLVVPGQSVEVEVQIWNGGDEEVALHSVALRTPEGWPIESVESPPRELPPHTLVSHRFRVTVPVDAEPTRLYFLRAPRSGGVYSWPASSRDRGRPFGAPVIEAQVSLAVDGRAIGRSAEAVYRFADQARGEVRRPLFVVPAVGVQLEPATTIWPLGRSEPLNFNVELRGESAAAVSGRVWLEAPDGWSVTPSTAAFELEAPGSAQTIDFVVDAPAELGAGRHEIVAVAESEDGSRYRVGYSVIDYTHIRRSVRTEEAKATIEAFELTVDKALRIGYVPGAGDAVAEAIAAMGLDVAVLDQRAVAKSDLSAYGLIVLGIRAYETNPALVENNGRFLEWVRAGGTLISQYQQYSYFRGDYAPYPLAARRPHDRVSDELAPVEILVRDHPAFTQPNVIGPGDFEGWVQERGLYFASEWDERFQPLVQTADAGEEWKRGGLLVAEFGDGLYVYTGLAFFRQLPAGVPGAYRLLANLLSLKG